MCARKPKDTYRTATGSSPRMHGNIEPKLKRQRDTAGQLEQSERDTAAIAVSTLSASLRELTVHDVRETLIKAFPAPDLRCEATNSHANPCDPPEVAKEMLI